MSFAELLIEEIKTLPSDCLPEVLEFVEFIKHKEAKKSKYNTLSKDDAVLMASDVIEKYRPALEDLVYS